MDGVLLQVEGDSQRRGGVVGEVLIGGPQVIIVLQCVAVCCSVLQCVAVRCSVLLHIEGVSEWRGGVVGEMRIGGA